MFASTDTAARIERAESTLMAGAARAVAMRRPAEDVWVRDIAGGVATVMRSPSPLNKVAGLGFDGVPTSGELDEVEREFRARGAPVQTELSSLSEPGVAETLSRRGYTLVGFEDVLGLDVTEPPDSTAADGVTVEVSGPESFDVWLDVIVTGFANPDRQGVASHESYDRDVLAAVVSDMVSAAGFVRTLARLNGLPAGAAGMRLTEGTAQLTGAATLPRHRRRGVQTTLLEERLKRAHDAGCDLAVVTTGPGTKSQENVQRRGFSLLYTRAVMVLE